MIGKKNVAFGFPYLVLTAVLRPNQLVSRVFIAGALLHAGMLYLATAFGLSWARAVLEKGIGPALILAGLLPAAIATAHGLRTQPRNGAGP